MFDRKKKHTENVFQFIKNIEIAADPLLISSP